MLARRFFSTAAKRVVNNNQNSGQFTDKLHNTINRYADNIDKFAESTSVLTGNVTTNVGKFMKSVSKNTKRLYNSYDADTSAGCGSIGGALIGGIYGHKRN